MYIPAHFAADDAAVTDLLVKHGAADLITLTDDGLLATMLPFAYEPSAGEHGTLAFMFESRWMIIPTRQALHAEHRQPDYDAVWAGLTPGFST